MGGMLTERGPEADPAGAPSTASGIATAIGVVGEVSRRVDRVSLDIADIATDVRDVAGVVEGQEAQFGRLRHTMSGLTEANRWMVSASSEAMASCEGAGAEVADSRAAVGEAVAMIARLIDGVGRIERQLAGVNESLGEVAGVSRAIEGIAKQTNLLALNATIEAARAGESGRGFAVVAGEVKALARQTQTATRRITDTIRTLSDQVGGLLADSAAAVGDAAGARRGTALIDTVIAHAADAFDSIRRDVAEVGERVRGNLDRCAEAVAELDALDHSVTVSADRLSAADGRLAGLRETSEALTQYIGFSPLPLRDRVFVDTAIETAARIGDAFARAVDAGEIGMAELFSDDYAPVPGSDPEQFTHPQLRITDRILPDIQEPLLAMDGRVMFACACDRNAYLPTHILKFSQPQGPDPVWNAANCRNRRFYNVGTNGKMVRNPEPSINVMRRDLGGGRIMLTKMINAPVMVRGRQWGAFTIGVIVGDE